MSWVGSAVKRVEDPALLQGKGQFVDDIHLPNMVEAAILRSPYAHARIGTIDATALKKSKASRIEVVLAPVGSIPETLVGLMAKSGAEKDGLIMFALMGAEAKPKKKEGQGK
mgnify:CR=1 FL=1